LRFKPKDHRVIFRAPQGRNCYPDEPVRRQNTPAF
jgi:hypothetical protein